MARNPTRSAKSSDRLSATLASGALAKLVSYYAVRPDAAPHLRALMRETELTARSVQLELIRLERLGLVERNAAPDGRVIVQAVRNRSAWAPFRALVRAYADPVDLIRLALADIQGIAGAFVFGSVANKTSVSESDVDVFVVASVGSHADVRVLEQEIARRAVESSLAIGHEVNVVVRTAAQLNERHTAPGFYQRVLTGPKRWLRGSLRTIESARHAAAPGASP